MYPLFKIYVEYIESEDQIKFSPNSDNFNNAILRVMKVAHEEIGNVKMLFTDPLFND